MIITGVEKIDKKRALVFLDYEYAFCLYNSELYRYGIKLDGELTAEEYDTIMKETVIRRAKQKALDILGRADKSEFMLRKKLKDARFNEIAVEIAIEYINSYHYLNDERYAYNYYISNKGSKSYREIVMKLKQNGVAEEVLQHAIENSSEEEDTFEAEVAAVKKVLAKKKYTPGMELEYKERYKLMQTLFHKGFSESAIKQAMEPAE